MKSWTPFLKGPFSSLCLVLKSAAADFATLSELDSGSAAEEASDDWRIFNATSPSFSAVFALVFANALAFLAASFQAHFCACVQERDFTCKHLVNKDQIILENNFANLLVKKRK